MNTVSQVKQDYDRVAEGYTRALYHELDQKPFDREQLRQFAKAVAGTICDLGCGPGHVTRYLKSLGSDVIGIDLSPAMVAQARDLNPGIEFREGNMLQLDISDGALGGIVAFYSIVNIPATLHRALFRELARVLRPGGRLLLAFHVGDEIVRPQEMWGIPVSMEFYFFQPTAIQEQLLAAGFMVEECKERDPYPPDVEHQSRRAYILASVR